MLIKFKKGLTNCYSQIFEGKHLYCFMLRKHDNLDNILLLVWI